MSRKFNNRCKGLWKKDMDIIEVIYSNLTKKAKKHLTEAYVFVITFVNKATY